MHNFDAAWRQKLATQIDSRAGPEIRERIFPGSSDGSQFNQELDVIEWTREVMVRMGSLLDPQACRDILTACACHYPEEQLIPLRSLYERTGDIQLVHNALQEQFQFFLRETLHLDDTMIANVLSRGWGVAGILNGNSIIAIKIPKSGFLKQYLQESDPEIRRSIYCHCPRVRHAVSAEQELPEIYCYCGAGFYKHIWETIIGRSLDVEVLESVLSGGEVCRVMIKLPAGT
jgi:hypothetical protein